MKKAFVVSDKDKAILRELGRKKAELAARPIMAEYPRLWQKVNDLAMERPMVYVNEICWHEMNVDDELTLCCEGAFAREWEQLLRREIYQAAHIRDNSVVQPWLECPMVVYDSGFGIDEEVDIAVTDSENDIVSRHFHVLIEAPEDIEKIKEPHIEYQEAETIQRLETLREVFDGILPVRLVGLRGLWFTPWDYLIRVMGIEDTMMNLIMEPEFINQVVERYGEKLRPWKERATG